MATKTTDEEVEDEGPKQTVRLMAEDISPDVGPYFPSGMSAPEAALSGATANLTDEEVEQIRDSPGAALMRGDRSDDE